MTTQTLEQITESPSLFRRARNTVLGAALTTILAACNAVNYIPPRADDADRSSNFTKFEYNGKDTKEVSKAFIEEMKVKGKIDAYKVSESLGKIVDENYKPRSDEATAFIELEKQNKYIATLFSDAKINQLLIHSVKRNTDHVAFEQYAPLSDDDVRKVKNDLSALDTSLRELTFAKRQKLKEAFKDNKEFSEMLAYNEGSLNRLNQFYVAIADSETIEGHIDAVYDANQMCANIQKSLTGVDQYGKMEGEGRQVLEKLLEQKVINVMPADSIFAQTYRHSDKKLSQLTLKEAYDDIMVKIYDEAQDWGEKTIHTITNEHLASALNIASEAHKRKYIDDSQYQAVIRVMTKDALDKMGAPRPQQGISAWKILESIIPGWSFIVPFIVGRTALSHNHYSADAPKADITSALAETLTYGNQIKNGQSTSWNFRGDNTNSRVRFYSAIASDLVQIGAGLYFGISAGGNGGGSSSGSTATAITQGGEIGGPGTGP